MPQVTQSTGEAEINKLNEAMRGQPWYQEFFRVRGLNPDRVKLNEQQRTQLAQIANQNGYQLGDRMKIDEAGNINQQGGFAGMPTWAKVAIAAAAIAGTGGALGAAGVGPMAGMMGGGGGAGVGSAGLGTGLNAAIAGNAAHAAGGGLMMGTGGLVGAGTAAAVPTLASTGFGGITATPSLAGSTAQGAGSMAAKGGGSVISNLLNSDNLADAGSLFERFANDEANKRTSDFNMTSRYNSDMISAQQDRRAQEADAMKKIQQAGYIKSGGTPFDASKIQLAGGRTLPNFSLPRAPITDEAKQGASLLETEMLKRLGPNGSYTPKPVEDFTRRGVGEQIGRWGGIGTTGLQVGKSIWDLYK